MQIQEILKYGDYSINNKHVLITSELSDDQIYIIFKTTASVAVATAFRGTLRRLSVDIATACRGTLRRISIDIATFDRRRYWVCLFHFRKGRRNCDVFPSL